MKKIYTIGYTAFLIDDFIKNLKDNKINVLIDVRSMPFSERFPDYNKDNLRAILKDNNIIYRNYNKEFGARQEAEEFYSKDLGCLDFECFAKSKQFNDGIKKINEGIEAGYNFVLMCSEKDPLICHRAILVSRAFYEKGYEIIHLLENGKVESQGDIELQLLNKYFPNRNQINIFSMENIDEKEYVRKAYIEQNKKIGYKLED